MSPFLHSLLLCTLMTLAKAEPAGAKNVLPDTLLGVQRVTTSVPEPSSTGPAAVFQEVKVTTAEFDPKTLAQRLRDTKAIGFLTKLQLKGDIDGLLKELEELRHGQGHATVEQLHERFQLLFDKIVSLLQDQDPGLAKSITNARQSLWDWVSDPNKSVKL
jgi:hypothetical protein